MREICYASCLGGTRNMAQVNRRKDFSKYQPNLGVKKLKLKRDWLQQQVNDPNHTSKSTMNYIKKHKLKLLEKLSQYSDLNIIEKLCKNIQDKPRTTLNLEVFG